MAHWLELGHMPIAEPVPGSLGEVTSSKVEQIWGSNHRAITGSHSPDISKVKNPVLWQYMVKELVCTVAKFSQEYKVPGKMWISGKLQTFKV